jgi:hypothetical protein
MTKKTIFFEEEYGVSMDNIKTTTEVDAIIEKKIGRKLKVVDVPILPVKEYKIEEMVK